MIAGGAISGAVTSDQPVHAGGSDRLRIAVVGCGRRARTLLDRVLEIGGPQVELVALCDLNAAQTQATFRSLKGRFQDQIAQDCLRDSGIDSIQSAIESNADLVYLATPPVYRPDHFRMAVDAGKHVFLEKPLAADLDGLRAIKETAAVAAAKELSIFVGFQRRHDSRYQETIAQIESGGIGDPLFARAFCNAGPLRRINRQLSGKGRGHDEAFEIQNWNHFQWTGGDFLLEQHISGLDVIHWALDRIPLVAQGQGGWGNPDLIDGHDAERLGEVFDHHTVEFEFDGGVHLLSQCRRVAKSWNNTSEHVHGTIAKADLSAGKIFSHDGKLIWKSSRARSADQGETSQAEFVLENLLQGTRVSEIDSSIRSTLFALLGLEASRSGKRVRMDKLVRTIS